MSRKPRIKPDSNGFTVNGGLSPTNIALRLLQVENDLDSILDGITVVLSSNPNTVQSPMTTVPNYSTLISSTNDGLYKVTLDETNPDADGAATTQFYIKDGTSINWIPVQKIQ